VWREFYTAHSRVPELLIYARVGVDGISLNKVGSLSAAWPYRGAALDSSGALALAAVSARVNTALARH